MTGPCKGCAISGETVFSRTLLDLAIHSVLTTRSSLAAAAAMLAFQMRASASLHGYEVGVLRRMICLGTDLYARTIVIIPEI